MEFYSWQNKYLAIKHYAVLNPATDQRLNDGGGLYLLIKTNGAKWWRFDYSIEGKRKTLSLGVYPVIGLAAARRKRCPQTNQQRH
ncbi:hypothetical protein BCS42_01345 [Crenothrix sp. D3]|nr:hypothetical protein BCS42_01345 [Crenothrix sp. D3]